MISFFIPCVPPKTTHHSKRIVRVGKFSKLADTPALSSARAFWAGILQPHAPATPVDGPVELGLIFTWPWRSGDSKAVRRYGRIPCRVKPDASNIAKSVEDILVALRFLEDDNQVARLVVEKWIGDRPGIKVQLCSFEVGKEQLPREVMA